MRVLVTGNAGFIGFHIAKRLLERGDDVVGVDVVSDYYDTALKHARLEQLTRVASGKAYSFHAVDLADRKAVAKVFEGPRFDRVVHLAAQAGVRYSLTNPHAYTRSNIEGTLNILEGCRGTAVPHLAYASSSSVYGANSKMPFSEHDSVSHPLSVYAATKRATELLAHSYSHLYRLPTTALRFFTVYGPWGRPDMVPIIFARKIQAGEPIDVFNNGGHTRDFTYIDDVVKGVVGAMDRIPAPDPRWDSAAPDPASSSAPYRIYNIGNNAPVTLMQFIHALEASLGRPAVLRMQPLQMGDVPDTHADISELAGAIGYSPRTTVQEGVRHFVDWYRAYYPGV